MSFIKRFGFPAMFAACLTGFFMRLYTSGPTLTIWTAGAFLVSIVCFLFLNMLAKGEDIISKRKDKLARRKKLVWLFYLVVMEIVLLAIFILIKEGGGNNGFLRWLFKNASPYNARYLLAAAMGLVFFVSSSVYYFTEVLNRSAIIFLLPVIVFALYGKVNAEFPPLWLTVLLLLFLAVWIQGRFLVKEKKSRYIFPTGYFGAIALFGALAGALAWLVPKPVNTPYREEFDRFTERVTLEISASEAGFSDFADASGVNNGNNRPTDKVLYEVETEESFYLRTQSYDLYKPSGWETLRGEQYEHGWNDWKDYSRSLSSDKLIGLISWAAESKPEIFTNEQLQALSGITCNEKESYYIVYPIEETFRILFSNQNQFDYSFYGKDYSDNVYRTIRNEFFISTYNNTFKIRAMYKGSYYSGHFSEALSRFTTKEFSDILSGINEVKDEVPDKYRNALYAWSRELREAEEYKDAAYQPDYEGKELISALAFEITADCGTEYEKARAIESYFYNGEYAYDLDYVPQKPGAEHFMFESKRGICSDFATAMTLLAREAGLSARYTEGAIMTPSERSPTRYEVRTSGIHAFPEIYIAGNGWTIFEPTVPQKSFWETFWIENKLWVVSGSALLLTAVLIFILRHIISEAFFLCIIACSPRRKAVSRMFLRLCALAGKKSSEDKNKITARSLSEEISRRGAEPDKFIRLFEETVYGDKPIEAAEYKAAYDCYKKCRKAMLESKSRTEMN